MKYTQSPIYTTWERMNDRCKNINNNRYKYYGGKNVIVEWSNFQEFYNDMFSTWKKGLSIERINVNGNYSKRNCRWATPQEQSRNKTNNCKYKGECAIEASIRLNGCKSLVSNRINRGWSFKKAFNTPVK